MEVQIKKTVKAGNSSAVILPRAWLNKEVRVELLRKTSEAILQDVVGIIGNYISMSDVIGIYLTGSYARFEDDKNSDIDVLVVTNDIDKSIIKEGAYNLLIASAELIAQKLRKDLLPIGQMLREAKPLLNSVYLNSINVKVTKKNIEWYIKTTQDKLRIIKKVIEIAKKKDLKYIDKVVAYTLVLRIRTLHIIDKIIKNENYLKKDFIKIIKSIGRENAYELYLSVKNNSEKKQRISVEEAERLYDYLENELDKIKKMLK